MSFLVQVNESDESLAALCRRFGISRKTGVYFGPDEALPEALVRKLIRTRIAETR